MLVLMLWAVTVLFAVLTEVETRFEEVIFGLLLGASVLVSAVMLVRAYFVTP